MRWTYTILTVAVIPLVSAGPAAASRHGDFDWPLHPRPAVVRHFDKPAHNWLPGHRGVDLAGIPDRAVLAAGPGIVTYAGSIGDKPVVTVEHSGGLRTTYEPVRASVAVGTRVSRGTVLGTLTPGHPCPAPTCLHWGLLRRSPGYPDPRGEYLDPLGLLHQVPLRLKPSTGSAIAWVAGDVRRDRR